MIVVQHTSRTFLAADAPKLWKWIEHESDLCPHFWFTFLYDEDIVILRVEILPAI